MPVDSAKEPARSTARTSRDPLLQPFRIKHVQLKNRVMSTSHAAGLEVDGIVAPKISSEVASACRLVNVLAGCQRFSPGSALYLRQCVGYASRVTRRSSFRGSSC